MATTSRGYPYPDLDTDPPNGPAQIQALAQAVNNDVDALYGQPMARIPLAGTFTIPNGNTGWNQPTGLFTGAVADYDTDDLWSAQYGVFYCSKPGIYRSRLRVTFPVNSNGVRGVGFGWSSATVDPNRAVQDEGSGYWEAEVTSEGQMPTARVSYVRPMVIHTGAGPITLTAQGEFTIEWVRPLPGASS